MPAEEGCDEVGGAEDVEGSGQSDAGEAVEAGKNPRYLGLVNAEMGGDGAVAALGGEDAISLVAGDCGCGCGSILDVIACRDGCWS